MPQMTDSSLARGLKVEARVIPALMLREIHTIHGGSSLGYLWVIIHGLFGIGIFWGVREIFGFRALYGISVPVFLIVGFAVWNIFQGAGRKLSEAANGNRALLTFPQVTHLDLLVSRTLVIGATELLVAALMLTTAVIWGAEIGPVDWAQFLTAILLVAATAFGLGAVLTFFCQLLPALRQIMPMLFRALFFCSGDLLFRRQPAGAAGCRFEMEPHSATGRILPLGPGPGVPDHGGRLKIPERLRHRLDLFRPLDGKIRTPPSGRQPLKGPPGDQPS